MAGRGRRSARSKPEGEVPEAERGIQGAPLRPIRMVERELTRPDGTKLRVKVPVYPPFRLAERPEPGPAGKGRRSARSGRRRKAS